MQLEEVRAEHRKLGGKPLPDLAHIAWLISPHDRELLTKWGAWLDALASGKIPPLTPAQLHFLAVHRGEIEPETQFERIWIEVLAVRKKLEEERIACKARGNSGSPSTPPMFYACPSCGMVGSNCTCGRSWY